MSSPDHLVGAKVQAIELNPRTCAFERICGILGLDANAIRQRLRVAPESQPVPASHDAVRHA